MNPFSPRGNMLRVRLAFQYSKSFGQREVLRTLSLLYRSFMGQALEEVEVKSFAGYTAVVVCLSDASVERG